MTRMKTVLSCFAAALFGAGLLAAVAVGVEDRKSDPYTLTTCPVTGKELGSMGDPVVKEIDGREVRFCCAPCIGKLEADKETYFKKIDAELARQQQHYYPLDTCVVRGDALEEGKTIEIVHRNRLVKVCCRMCARKFNSEPEKFLAELDKQVIEKQREHYPLKTCLVSGEELGGMGEPVEVVIGNRLVRLCCGGCKKGLMKDAAKHIATLDAAWKKQHEKAGHGAGAGHAEHHGKGG